jgi:hypothetical protein
MREEIVFTIFKSQQDILRKYSSFDKLKKIIAYCLRVKDILFSQRKTMSLTVEELQRAELTISCMVQSENFSQELRALQQGKRVHTNSQTV